MHALRVHPNAAGNSCDLGHIREELEVLAEYLSCHCLAIEYPGYGLAAAATATAAAATTTTAATAAAAAAAASSRQRARLSTSDVINLWGRAAFNFLIFIGVPPENIICFGRSIGTGAAAAAAAAAADADAAAADAAVC